MFSELANKISDSELEIMKVLWRANDALPVNVIRETLQSERGWEATTIKTLVSRLTAKGVLQQEKRGSFYYTPRISEGEYNEWAAGNLIQKLFHGSAKALLSTLVRSDELTKSDIEELRQMFTGEE